MPVTKKILVVDDEPFCLKILKKRLELHNYEVITACGGHEAIDKVSSDKPDLILLDMMLPVISGLEVCKNLKSNPVYSPIPIIICSANIELAEEIAGSDISADDYISKPVDWEELINKIQKYVI